MNTNSKIARRHAIALTLITLGLGNYAHASQEWCLSRGEGAGLHYQTAQTIYNPKEWVSQGALLVHSAKNQTECAMLGASCNGAPGDMITVSMNLNGELVLHRTRPTGRPVVRDIARMTIDPSGRFLSGFSEGSDHGFGQQVFLYYSGTGHCTDTGLDYAADAQCRFFSFEVFPVGVAEDHRPDVSGARWEAFGCPVASQQPSDNDTHEPPQP